MLLHMLFFMEAILLCAVQNQGITLNYAGSVIQPKYFLSYQSPLRTMMHPNKIFFLWVHSHQKFTDELSTIRIKFSRPGYINQCRCQSKDIMTKYIEDQLQNSLKVCILASYTIVSVEFCYLKIPYNKNSL